RGLPRKHGLKGPTNPRPPQASGGFFLGGDFRPDVCLGANRLTSCFRRPGRSLRRESLSERTATYVRDRPKPQRFARTAPTRQGPTRPLVVRSKDSRRQAVNPGDPNGGARKRTEGAPGRKGHAQKA